jgi:Na+/H+-dicarboxylate symporter/ABC-type amino acid transport substrate-binding protein
MSATEARLSLYRRWMRLSLTTRIVTGLALGIALGLFFGERTRALAGVADAYIRLMQMTVLPYLVVALMSGLGRLDIAEAKRLARYGGLALLLIWALALSVIGLMPLAFPEIAAGSFFSTSLVQPPAKISLVELYIPANPFQSMSRTVVPAVTLFSLSIGIALIGVPGKERFLESLDALLAALGRVTHFIVELTPYGVIPIAAVAAGTLAPEELQRLSVYFVTFIAASLLLGLWLLPAAVALLTPFRYGEVVGACRDAMITAFVTNNVFIVLPMLTEHCSKLAAQHGLDEHSVRAVPTVVVPIAFNFPTAGKLLTLLFVPFAAWLHGDPLPAHDYPQLLANGLFSYFAKAQVALPFLLDIFEIPSDLFNLYIPTTLINGKFDSAVGAMSLFAFTLVTAASLSGRLRVRPRALARAAVATLLMLGVAVVAIRVGMGMLLDGGADKGEALRAMHLQSAASRPPRDQGVAAIAASHGAALEKIRQRGTLRVGYQPERLPFSFRNAAGEIVGFDIEMAAQLARDLGLALELVPTQTGRFEEDLASGRIDLVPSVRYTHHWIGRLRLSTPYMDSTIGLLVRDWERDEFGDLAQLAARDGKLRVAIPGQADLYENYVRDFFGETGYELIELPSWEALFEAQERFDVALGLAEVGMAWSLVHPDFTVVIPKDRVVRRPLAFALAPDNEDLARVIDQWVVLQRARGNVDAAYDYWILGKGTEQRRPRWSIARDVLGWIE